MAEFLPYGRQTIEDDDVAAVVEALRADYLTTGPRVEAFEAAFAETVGAGYAVACSSGTAALHLAMLGLDLKPDESVIVPAITFAATANCARYQGAEVVFADVDPETGLMTLDTLRARLAGWTAVAWRRFCRCTWRARPSICRASNASPGLRRWSRTPATRSARP